MEEISLEALLEQGLDIAHDEYRRDPQFLVPDEDDDE